MMNCPYCGGNIAADATICPNCGGPTKKGAAVPGNQPSFGKQGTLTCPNCNKTVGAGDIVCVHCGTNLLTGQKPAKEPVVETRNNMQGAVNTLKIIGVLLLVVVCGGVLFLLAQQLLRDPVGEARQAAKAGSLEEAVTLLQQHLQSAPEDFEAQFLLGQIYWEGQQYDRAAEAFESVARQGGPKDKDAALLALLAAERVGGDANRQRQLALLRSLVQQRYPDDVELLKAVALLEGIEGERRAQLDTIDTLNLLNAVPPLLPGLALAMSDNSEDAEKALLSAANANPEDDDIAATLGFIHQMRGEEESALSVLQQAQDTAPEIAALVKLQLSVLFMKRSEYGKALPLITEAKAELPDDARCAFLHALCLQQNKLLDEALAAFERMASGTGEFTGLAALQIAIIYLDQGNYDQAASFAKRAGESGITSPRQSTVLGRVYAMQGDMNQAEQAYRRAISITGDYPAARLELGLLLINKGLIDEGLAELEQYLELAAFSPALYRVNEIELLVSQLKQTKQ